MIDDRIAKSMPTAYRAAECGIKPNHFKVSSGATYLRTSIETEVPENKARIALSGQKVLLEAMQQNGQDKNPAAWYYLGRIYLQQGDLYGGRLALTKAEQLAPEVRRGDQTLPEERLGGADEGGQQVRGRKERRLRPRALS